MNAPLIRLVEGYRKATAHVETRIETIDPLDGQCLTATPGGSDATGRWE